MARTSMVKLGHQLDERHFCYSVNMAENIFELIAGYRSISILCGMRPNILVAKENRC